MYHFQLFKRRHLDERKTLTKVSTRTPLTTIPQTKAHTSERENQEKLMQTARRLVKGPDTAETSEKILATNNSNQHVKVTKNQTLGMLKSCDSDQICTIHRLVTFEPKSLEGEGMKLEYTKNSQTINSIKTQPTTNNFHDVQSVTKDFYQIPT